MKAPNPKTIFFLLRNTFLLVLASQSLSLRFYKNIFDDHTEAAVTLKGENVVIALNHNFERSAAFRVNLDSSTVPLIRNTTGLKVTKSFKSNQPKSYYMFNHFGNYQFFISLKFIRVNNNYDTISIKSIPKLFGTHLFTRGDCSRERPFCYFGLRGGGKYFINSVDENANFVQHWRIYDDFRSVLERDGTTHLILGTPCMLTIDTSKTPGSNSYMLARIHPNLILAVASKYTDKVIAFTFGILRHISNVNGKISATLNFLDGNTQRFKACE